MVFMGRDFTSRGQESRSVFSTTVCKIQAGTINAVLKIKEAASHKVKELLYSCLLISCLPSGNKTLNWHLETIYSPQAPASSRSDCVEDKVFKDC